MAQNDTSPGCAVPPVHRRQNTDAPRAANGRRYESITETDKAVHPPHPTQLNTGSPPDPYISGAERRLSDWRAAQQDAKYWAEVNSRKKSRALKQARKVLRSGGFLPHVDRATGAERRISVEEAGEGVPFLSVWIRHDIEITKIHFDGSYGTPSSMPPRGAGWQFKNHDPVENSAEWHRVRRD